MTDAVAVVTPDGLTLEAELATAPHTRAAALLCHPHPQYGGSMRAGLVGDLFGALPAAGVTTLRFNFRGVERSGGTWDRGVGERLDVLAALDALAGAVEPSVPVLVVGWSFGADLALSTVTDRIAAWLAIAPPLHFAHDLDVIASDPRPKRIVLGDRDHAVSLAGVRRAVADWIDTVVQVVPGADHFFAGHSRAALDAALGLAGAVGR